jgi:hypothetical protein
LRIADCGLRIIDLDMLKAELRNISVEVIIRNRESEIRNFYNLNLIKIDL